MSLKPRTFCGRPNRLSRKDTRLRRRRDMAPYVPSFDIRSLGPVFTKHPEAVITPEGLYLFRPKLMTVPDVVELINTQIKKYGREDAKLWVKAECFSAWADTLMGVKPNPDFGPRLVIARDFIGDEAFQETMPKEGM